MNAKTYGGLCGVIFGLAALAHLVRAILGWDLVMGDFFFPVWASWLATAVTGCFSAWGFCLAGCCRRREGDGESRP